MNSSVAVAKNQPPLTVVGCGILRNEVNFLIEKNGWDLHTHYLSSSLHNYLDRLSNELNSALDLHERLGEETLVLYGSCHPLMDDYLAQHKTCRTQGQNCIAMLLGYERFMQELEKGAYFLLEDWALTWEPMITACFGTNITVIREIFHSCHKHILALRTPCNGDFIEAAEAVARFIDLPLYWMDVELDHLESVLVDAIQRRLAGVP